MQIAKAKKFERQYKKMPLKIKKQFATRLKLYLTNKHHPLLHVHSLQGEFNGMWSFNVTADIRVIFDQSCEDVLILVAIGSHSELYS